MPLSLVLTLTPEDDAPWPRPGGREAQAWFLRQVQALEPDLADALHAAPGGRRPYTVSAPMSRDWRLWPGGPPPQAPVYLRITAFTPALEGLLQNRLLPLWQGRIGLRLGGKGARVTAVATTPAEHPWAGSHTFGELVRFGQARREETTVRLLFASPTAFRSNGVDVPLPQPEHVLRSWWLAWNAAAPEPFRLDEQWPAFAAACVLVQRLSGVRTVRWRWHARKGGGAVGFLGRVDFRLRSPQMKSPWASLRPGAEAVLHTLAAFSLYAGTGHHTTIGMGQTKQMSHG